MTPMLALTAGAVDAVLLARVQFAANISFHILFPTITIALAWLLLYFKWRFRRSGDGAWMQAYRLWVKIYALSFAMGVVSGIVIVGMVCIVSPAAPIAHQ